MTYYGYGRVSTKEQSDNSLENQIKYLKIQSDILGFTSFEEYTEKLSGKNADRPLLKEIINKLDNGDVLGVYDNSRLGRDTEENLRIAKEITSKGAKLQVNGKIIDLHNPNDEMMLTIESAVSTYQRKNQNLKSRIGLDTVKEKGQWLFTSRLYGWDVTVTNHNPVVKVNENEAKVIQYVFNEYSKGRSVLQITKEINSLGYRSRSGTKFNVSMIRRMLFRPIYMGYYPVNGPGRKDYTRLKIKKDELVKSVYYQPIISEDLWWKVYDSYRTLQRTHAIQFEYRYSYYPLTSVIKCTCGTSYVHTINKNGHNNEPRGYYRAIHCPKTCTERGKGFSDKLIEPLFEQLYYLAFMFNEDVEEFLKQIKYDFDVSNNDLLSNIKRLDELIVENNNKIKNLYDAVEQGLQMSKVIPRIQSLEKDVKSLEEDKKRLELEIALEENELFYMIDVYSDEAVQGFYESDFTVKRKKYMEVFKSVRCSKASLDIEYLSGMKISIPLFKSTRWKSQSKFQINISRLGKHFTSLVWDSTQDDISVLEENRTKRKMVEIRLKDLQERVDLNK